MVTDLIRIVSERTCFSAGCQRLQLERELMFAGLPVLIDHVVIGPAILPAVFPRQAFPAVDLEDQPAAVQVEDPIHESLVGRQIHDKLVAAGMLDANRARNRRRLVIRQRQRPFVVLGRRGSRRGREIAVRRSFAPRRFSSSSARPPTRSPWPP